MARALAKPVAERYQSLEEMRDDLERLVRETAARLLAAQKDTAELVTAIERARAAGQLQKALTMCRRLLADRSRARGRPAALREVEEAIRVQEVEQLSGMALGYAADGDLDLALKIASKVQRLAPESARYRDLAAYLDEEVARRAVAALVTTAQEHIVLGNLEEARAAAEEVLAAQPDHAIAREIRDRAATVIAQRDRQLPPAIDRPRRTRTAPTVASARGLTADREPHAASGGPAADPEAVRLLEEARRLLKARDPVKAVPLLEQASTSRPTMAPSGGCSRSRAWTRAGPKPPPTPPPPSITSCRTITRRARKAVEKALSLDPENRRARELRQVLGASASRAWRPRAPGRATIDLRRSTRHSRRLAGGRRSPMRTLFAVAVVAVAGLGAVSRAGRRAAQPGRGRRPEKNKKKGKPITEDDLRNRRSGGTVSQPNGEGGSATAPPARPRAPPPRRKAPGRGRREAHDRGRGFARRRRRPGGRS